MNPVPRFVVSLGDNFYESGVKGISDELWETAWFSVFIRPFPSMHNIRWFSVLGNHDYYGGIEGANSQVEMTKQSKHWVMPSKDYYSYDKETSSYHIFIDTVIRNYMRKRTMSIMIKIYITLYMVLSKC